MKPKPLVIIPTYLTEPGDVDATLTAIESVRKTQGQAVEILAVDDGSPEDDLVERLTVEAANFGCDVHPKETNSGFSKTVNVGLSECLKQGRHAILLNADMEITTPGWLKHFKDTRDAKRQAAAVVGALLLYPNGTIQHAGVYLSGLTRQFDHRFKHGPQNLPEALEKEVCPVTGAFQFIRHDTLESIGLYDEGFYLGWEDVDYCLRVFIDGSECIYNPNVRGVHHEMMFRGRPSPKIEEWQNKSLMYLAKKWQSVSFARFVPTL